MNIEEVSFYSSNNNSSEETDLEDNSEENNTFQINTVYRENETVNVNHQLEKIELKVGLAK